MDRFLHLFFIFILVSGHAIQAARILAMVPFYGSSHHKFIQPILAALARAGHHLTVYSPFPMSNPPENYTDVLLDKVVTESDEITRVIYEMTEFPHWKCWDHYPLYIQVFYDEFLENQKVQSLLKSKEKFDLVITQALTMQEYTLILGHIFQAPVIVLHSSFTNNVINYFMGNDLSLTFMPDVCTPFPNKMSFFHRFLNAVYSLRTLLYIYQYKHLTVVDKMMRSQFPDMPPILEMINNVSLVFVNDHMTVDYAYPRPPNIISVAGIHIPNKAPLPQDIRKIMDEASEGVIVFSLGTYVPDHFKPKQFFDMFIKVFSRLPQKVLWKTKKDHIDGLPDNVFMTKWLPQRDILDHPNCVLFITHGGLLSQHETINARVPTIAIPQFFDQHRNAKFYEEKGIGIRLTNEDLSEETVFAAIKEVLGNPRYKENMKRLSQIFKDQPLSPAQTVVYWTEHVLRHGAAHLKPAASQLSFYQRALLDVAAMVTVSVLVMIVFVYFSLRSIVRIFFFKQLKKKPIKKKQK